MECKSCKYFVQGKGHSGTCKKRPYVSTRSGGVQMINGKPRVLFVSMGLELLSKYIKNIAERAIELNDEVLIDLLKDLCVLKEKGGEG